MKGNLEIDSLWLVENIFLSRQTGTICAWVKSVSALSRFLLKVNKKQSGAPGGAAETFYMQTTHDPAPTSCAR